MQEKNNSVWKATLHIANAQNGEKILYDIDPIKKVESPRKLGTTSTTDSIRQGGENVNTKFSARRDADYMKAVENGDTETAQRLVDEERRLAPGKNREYWENEVVANASERFVNDKGAMRALIAEHADVAKSVDQWFSKMNYALRRAFKGVTASNEAVKELLANAEVFSEAQKRWNALLEESVKAKKAIDVISKGEDNVQFAQRKNIYDYTKSFEEQIEDYKKGLIPKNDTLLVGATPKVWQKIGFNALPVTIDQAHVDYALNGTKDADHSIGETLLKDLPNQIKNPVAIIQSQSPGHSDRAVVIMKMAYNGKQVISAIEIDGQGKTNNIRIDSNAMATLFAKSNAVKQLNTAINNTVNGGTELFYWDKKEASTLLQRAGLQLPSGLPQGGFVHSITDQGSKVKPKFSSVIETQQFKRRFSDWQKNPKKASKVNSFVSDLGKSQYQLRREDINCLNILEGQEKRFSDEIKALEKEYSFMY